MCFPGAVLAGHAVTETALQLALDPVSHPPRARAATAAVALLIAGSGAAGRPLAGPLAVYPAVCQPVSVVPIGWSAGQADQAGAAVQITYAAIFRYAGSSCRRPASCAASPG